MNPAYSFTSITGKADVETVHVMKEQFVTIWLNGLAGAIQVELRVLSDGTPEIFCDGLQVKPFSEWYLPKAKQ